MYHVIIEHFGPVEHFEADLDNNLLLLIGPQASGKSTIAKLIFFFRSIKDDLLSYVFTMEKMTNTPKDKLRFNFIKEIRTKFVNYFGTTKHMEKFSIYFNFDQAGESKFDERSVEIHLRDGYTQIKMSQALISELDDIFDTALDYLTSLGTDYASIKEFNLWKSSYKNFYDILKDKINHTFNDFHTSLFIPAGRSLLATNSDFFHTVTPNKYDKLMNDFIERIGSLQKRFIQRTDELVINAMETDHDKNQLAIKSGYKILRKILKGDYVKDKDGEKIYYGKNRFVKLLQASSGQQEALWILLLILSIIIDNDKVFLVIEEPEAHLFPTAQKDIVDLIAILINSTDSQVLITTHSPYILTSVNLLIFSNVVETGCIMDSETQVVDPLYRLDGKRIDTYLLGAHEDGHFYYENIMDKDTQMIYTEHIDSVSTAINSATEALLNMEASHEL